MSSPLSPAAQAVMDATGTTGTPLELAARGIAAVALRAAADQVDAVDVPDHIRGDTYWSYRNGRAAAKAHLIAIADELEGY